MLYFSKLKFLCGAVMGQCKKCGKQLSSLDIYDDYCMKCAISNFGLEDKVEEEKFKVEKELQRQKERLLEKKSEIDSILVTSLFQLEGKKVKKYFDIICAEVVIGTGLFSEISSDFTDFFGGRGGSHEGKLKEAKKMAMESIKKECLMLGANAVLGVDVDYMDVGRNNMLMVTISGTPVLVEDFLVLQLTGGHYENLDISM